MTSTGRKPRYGRKRGEDGDGYNINGDDNYFFMNVASRNFGDEFDVDGGNNNEFKKNISEYIEKKMGEK